MIVIGHRGAPTEALENSMDSFNKAVEAGCKMIELDVWCAKDSSLWVSHDSSLKRTANTNIEISSSLKSELSQVTLINHESLLELKDCLDKLLPAISINIELKNSSESAAHSLLNAITNLSDKSKIVISSFYIEPLEYIEKKDPSLQLALLWEENSSSENDPIEYLKRHSTWFFHPQANMLNYKIIQQLHENKTTVYPWVPRDGVEDQDREFFWQTIVAFKVHGLCTNYPREFNSWLKKIKGEQH